MPSNLVLAVCVAFSAVVGGISATTLTNIGARVDATTEGALDECTAPCANRSASTPACGGTCRNTTAPPPPETPSPPPPSSAPPPTGCPCPGAAKEDNDVIDAKDLVRTGDITIVGDDVADLEDIVEADLLGIGPT